MGVEGFRFGQALHDLLVRKDVAAHNMTLGPATAHRWQAVTAFMEAGEREHADLARGIVNMLTEAGDLPPALDAVLQRAGGPTAQFDWLLQLVLLVVGIFSAAGTLLAPSLQDLLNKQWETNLDMPVTVQELALAELRGFIDHDHALKLSRETGYSPDKYDIIFNDTGEPPSIQELLYLWRRGHIDKNRLEHGVRQSRVRDEWIDAIEALAYVPPSPQEAIAAAVQGHLSDADAAIVVQQSGIDPAAYGWLKETAGRPPGIEQMLALLNRGVVTETDVTNAIMESDVKDKYIPAVLQMRRHLMPERTVVSGISKGVFTRDEGIAHLLLLGFSPEDAAALASEASTVKTATHKSATEANIVTAYRDQMIGRADAHDRLVALKYDPAEADFVLDLADIEADQALRRQLVNATRAKYVAHHLDDNAASTALDTAKVPASQRDQLLTVWKLERDANTRQLTPAVMVKGVKNGALSWSDFLARMGQLGYSAADAQLYGAIEGIGPPAA